ncbi:MAG: hypothetical protein MJ211_12645 [Bacteroidales bacterium]|nr:hypothetical protein [Bacteroidales bacterium]
MIQNLDIENEYYEPGEINNFNLDLIATKSNCNFDISNVDFTEEELLMDLDEFVIDGFDHDLSTISKIFEE